MLPKGHPLIPGGQIAAHADALSAYEPHLSAPRCTLSSPIWGTQREKAHFFTLNHPGLCPTQWPVACPCPSARLGTDWAAFGSPWQAVRQSMGRAHPVRSWLRWITQQAVTPGHPNPHWAWARDKKHRLIDPMPSPSFPPEARENCEPGSFSAEMPAETRG